MREDREEVNELFMDDENNLIIIRQILQRQQTLTMFAEH